MGNGKGNALPDGGRVYSRKGNALLEGERVGMERGMH